MREIAPSQDPVRVRSALVLAALCVLSAEAPCQPFVWSNAAGGAWNVGSNWVGNSWPINQPGRDALIHFTPNLIAGSDGNFWVTLPSWATVRNLRCGANFAITGNGLTLSGTHSSILRDFSMSGGNLDGIGTLTVSGQTVLTGGALRGTGRLIANGGIRLDYPVEGVIRRRVDAYGASEWRSGVIFGTTGLDFNNFGTLTLSAPSSAAWNDSRVVNQAGAVIRRQGQSSNLSVPLYNLGRVEVVSGGLTVRPAGVHTGDFVVQPGATLLFGAGNLLGPGSVVSGAGLTLVNANKVVFDEESVFAGSNGRIENFGVWEFNGLSSIVAPAAITVTGGGTLVLGFGASIQLSSLALQGGTVNAQTPVTISGPLTVTGSVTGTIPWTITGPTTLINATVAAPLICNGGLILTDPGDNRIFASSTLGGNSIWTGGTVFTTGAQITNYGTFTVSSPNIWRDGTFTNLGSVLKTGPSTTKFASSNGFNNRGTTTVELGTLALTGNNTHSGRFAISDGATLLLSGATTLETGARIGGPGLTQVNSTSVSFESGSTLAGPIVSLGGTVNFQDGSLVDPSVDLFGTSGSINFFGAAPTTIGSLQSTGAAISNSRALTVTGGLTLSSTLSGPGSWHILGPFTFSGGSIAAGGPLVAAGGGALTTTADKSLQRPAGFSGAFTWQGGTVFGNNQPFTTSGHFHIQGDLTWSTGALTNTGSLVKESGTGLAHFQGLSSLTNSGTISSESGELRFSGPGEHTGVVSANGEGSVVNLIGEHTFDAPARVEGSGAVLVDSGPATFNLGTSILGDLRVRNGGPTQNRLSIQQGAFVGPSARISIQNAGAAMNTGAAVSFASLTMDNANLTGADEVILSGPLTLISGQLGGTAPMTLNGGVQFTGPNLKTVARDLTLNGTSSWSGGPVLASPYNITLNGTLDISAAAKWSGSNFVNRGTVRRVGLGGPSQFLSAGLLSNFGVVEAASGQLQIGATSQHFGRVRALSGATVTLKGNNTFRSGSFMEGAGTLRVESGSQTFQSGSIFTASNAVFQGGTTLFAAGSLVNFPSTWTHGGFGTVNFSTGATRIFSSLTLASGNMTGSDLFRVTGPLQMTGGSLTGSGNTDILGGLQLSGSPSKSIGRTLELRGTSTFSGGAVNASGSTVTNFGTFRPLTDQLWTGGTFVNLGTVHQNTTATTALYPSIFTNTGLVNVSQGQLRLSGVNLLATNRELPSGQFIVSGSGTLRLDNLQGSLLVNSSRLRLIGPGARCLDSSGINAMRDLVANPGVLEVESGHALTELGGFGNTGILRVDSASSLSTTGPLVLSGGVIKVDGSLAATGIQMFGGQLVGTGTIQSGIANSALISPGDPVGQMDLVGNFVQSFTGSIQIDVMGALPGQFDLLNVTGTVGLSGELRVLVSSEAQIPSGTRLPIIQGTGARAGTFNIVPPPGEWNVIYTPNGVELERVGGTGVNAIVSGTLRLGGLVGPFPGATISLRRNGVVEGTYAIAPAPNGFFTFATPLRGNYDFVVSAPHWLRRVIPDVNVTNFGAVVSPNLVGGDATLDNQIGPADFSVVLAAFGTESGEPGYSLAADVNRDGAVAPSDFSLVLDNFGQEGDL